MELCEGLLHTGFKFINIYLLLKKFSSAYRQLCLGHSMVLVPHPDTRQLLGQTRDLVTELLKNILELVSPVFIKYNSPYFYGRYQAQGTCERGSGNQDMTLDSGLSIIIVMTPTSTLQSTPSRELISSPTVFTLPSSWEISLKKVHFMIYCQSTAFLHTCCNKH